MSKKYIIIIIISVLLIFIATYNFYNFYKFRVTTKDYVLVINTNDTANSVINKLSSNSNSKAIVLKIIFKVRGLDKSIKPGSYHLETIENIFELSKVLVSKKSYIEKNGKVIKDDYVRFTIIEGWNIYDISHSLSKKEKLNISYNTFINKCYDEEYINSLGLHKNITSLEGFLYPETYYLLPYYSEEDILRIFVEEFKKQLNLLNLADDNIYNILTIASIIESESKLKDEMPDISSVFYNRLADDMKLDADPTILFCMQLDGVKENYMNNLGSKESIKLFKKYKNNKDCNYNTYYYNELPPTPICNPSKNALIAAINPSNTNYKYFVADGTGRHLFSNNLREHINKINELRITQ